MGGCVTLPCAVAESEISTVYSPSAVGLARSIACGNTYTPQDSHQPETLKYLLLSYFEKLARHDGGKEVSSPHLYVERRIILDEVSSLVGVALEKRQQRRQLTQW